MSNRARPPSRSLVLLAAAVLVGCASPSTSATSVASSPTVPPTIVPVSPSASAALVPSAEPSPTPGGDGPPELTLVPVVDGLDSPLDLAWRAGDPAALYVVEQAGRIRAIRDGTLVREPVLDIAGIVTAGGEQGLLGLAFHPDPTDPRLFVYYTALDGDQVLAAYRMDPGRPDTADPDSGQVLIRMADEFGNHNGGSLAFGPDGYLYVGTGDGGGGGDPLDSGRRLDTLLAKVLRIDVDGASPDGVGYRIPPDNPFVDTADARPEIWHTGLRNPWRLHFDRATGDLWIGDVGQGRWEEIDRAPAGVGGLDFGWNVMEGFHCFRNPEGDDCATAELTLPVAEYGHDLGCSVTGGTVYRGSAIPALVGRYVFADYCSGLMWTIPADGVPASERQEPALAFESGRSISAIAEDAAGELYVTDLSSGSVLRIASPAT